MIRTSFKVMESLLDTMPKSHIPEIQEEILEIHAEMKSYVDVGNKFCIIYQSKMAQIPGKIMNKLSRECRELFEKSYANSSCLIEHNPWEDPRCSIERQLRRIEGAWKGIQGKIQKEKEEHIRKERAEHIRKERAERIRKEREERIRKVEELQHSLGDIKGKYSDFHRDIVYTYHQLGKLQDDSIKSIVLKYQANMNGISEVVRTFIKNTYKIHVRLEKYNIRCVAGNVLEYNNDTLEYDSRYIKEHMKWFEEKVQGLTIVKRWMDRMFKIENDKNDIVQKEYIDKISKLEEENKNLVDKQNQLEEKIKMIDELDIRILL